MGDFHLVQWTTRYAMDIRGLSWRNAGFNLSSLAQVSGAVQNRTFLMQIQAEAVQRELHAPASLVALCKQNPKGMSSMSGAFCSPR
jgi:hypothetical protein